MMVLRAQIGSGTSEEVTRITWGVVRKSHHALISSGDKN